MMHSNFSGWWHGRRHRSRHCGSHSYDCSPGHHHGHDGDGPGFGGGGGGFGVRRPLRFLAYKLDLDERQVAELARILDTLKTERAQGEVDQRRTLAAFADAMSGETLDADKIEEAGALRVQTAERLKAAVAKALGEIHELLGPDQRERFAYLIRSGRLIL